MSTSYDSMRRDIRRERADALVAAIMHEIGGLLSRAEDLAHAAGHPMRLQADVAYKIGDLFRQEGAEVLTDQTRKAAGLPPRGADGWTAAEMAALEKARLDLLMAPIRMPIISAETAKPARG